MSENLERVQLGADEEEMVSGGLLQYHHYKDGYHIFKPSNPNVLYTFVEGNNISNQEVIKRKMHEKDLTYYDGKTEDEVIAEFLRLGWIKPYGS